MCDSRRSKILSRVAARARARAIFELLLLQKNDKKTMTLTKTRDSIDHENQLRFLRPSELSFAIPRAKNLSLSQPTLPVTKYSRKTSDLPGIRRSEMD